MKIFENISGKDFGGGSDRTLDEGFLKTQTKKTQGF